MKLLHTADWHLGRLFHQVHLTDDQEFVLGGMLQVVAAERPDAVIVAGDVFDRAVPPPEAVELYDRVLSRLAGELRIPLVIISGNHDSAARLGVGADLLKQLGVHVVTKLSQAGEPIVIRGADGAEVELYALPYAEPAEVRQFFGDESIRDHAAAMQALCNWLRSRFTGSRRRVLVAHAFVTGGRESESERPLTVGGSGMVDVATFAGFDYVALGHLHEPQTIGSNAAYAGSLLKYSFSECEQEKSVTLVELPERGEATRRLIPLAARRNVRCLEGELRELIERGRTDPGRDDYLQITLTDDGAVLNAMARLRESYPNALHIERRFLQARGEGETTASARRGLSDADLFQNFVRDVLGQDATPAELAVFAAAVEAADRELHDQSDRGGGPRDVEVAA